MIDETPFGTIDRYAQTDRYDNPVSLITLTDGKTFRMVHHHKGWRKRMRATIYAGRGKFVRVDEFDPDSDMEVHHLTVAGYRVEWGDGDFLGASSRQDGPNLNAEIYEHCAHDESDDALLFILSRIADNDALWEHKEVAKAA